MLLSVLLVLNWRPSAPAAWLVVASVTTFVWSLAVILAASLFPAFLQSLPTLETLRTGAWVAFLITLVSRIWRLSERVNYAFVLAVAVNALFAGLLIVDLGAMARLLPGAEAMTEELVFLLLLARLAFAVGGLLLVENLYRESPPSNRWGIRTLCLGLGAIFIYDIVLYADALLFRGVDPDWFGPRGVVNALAVPLIAISAARNPAWKLDVHVSRRVVFHTVSLVATGTFLLLIAAAGYYLKEFGGDWGTLLQISFLVAALLIAGFVLSSGQFRARVRVFFAKHFFAHRYDYREEWLRFIGTVSEAGQEADLERRVIKSVCDIVDSPGGVLWLAFGDGSYAPAARWNDHGSEGRREPPDSPLVAFLRERQWTIDLNDLRSGEGDYDGLEAPAWALENPRSWLVVPLVHDNRLIGFLVLQQARASRALDWEDFDLLKTVGRQASSYLAEHQSQEALSEAREFEAFNRRFAFIMHDLKNLVSQLSLLVRNAEKHADNPEFRKDMLATLSASIAKMNDMLAKLNQTPDALNTDTLTALRPVLEGVVRQKRKVYDKLDFSWQGGDVAVRGEAEKLEQIFIHLVQNAIDASDRVKPVEVRAVARDAKVDVAIVDHGVGMSEAFVRNELFKPFKSTKGEGFGIGAYESQNLISTLGGHIEVSSAEGRGTTISVCLPAQPMVEAIDGQAMERASYGR